jgi:hypothetical protein
MKEADGRVGLFRQGQSRNNAVRSGNLRGFSKDILGRPRNISPARIRGFRDKPILTASAERPAGQGAPASRSEVLMTEYRRSDEPLRHEPNWSNLIFVIAVLLFLAALLARLLFG